MAISFFVSPLGSPEIMKIASAVSDKVKFSWLLPRANGLTHSLSQQGDLEWVTYPIPPEMGSGGLQKLDLALGMTLVRARHQFQPICAGRKIPLAEIELNLPEVTFHVQVVSGGDILHRELEPPGIILFGPGQTLFRLTDKVRLIPVLDGSSHTETIILTIGMTALNSLVGIEQTSRLIAFLGLVSSPSTVVHSIPAYVSATLYSAFPTSLSAASSRLSCQARILDYLRALIDYVGSPESSKYSKASCRERVRAVHDLLINTEGKLPTLDEIAARFARSPSLLNKEFALEYGATIHAFITDYRLNEAHAALLNGKISLKELSWRYGYSHVNHFNSAFRKKFGYPPGSLKQVR